MRVEITAEDILSSNQNSASDCPIARAVRRMTGEYVVVVLNGDVSGVAFGNAWRNRDIMPSDLTGPLTDEALKFITSFDRGEHVFPQTIELFEEPAP